MPHRNVWSIGLGTWFGIQVRLHMFFLMFATFTFFLAWRTTDENDYPLAVACLGVLLLSVVIHEIAHVFVALRLGGSVDAIVLGPLGGLRAVRVPHDPQSELLAVLAGPLASLALCLSCLSVVALQDQSSAAGLLNPLRPTEIFLDASDSGTITMTTLIRLSCWVNWWIVVVNLIPAFPFDGGRACQAFIQSLRPGIDKSTAVAIAATGARFVAILLLALAIMFHDSYEDSEIPSWLPLVLLSIFVFFSTRVEESQSDTQELDEALFGYDFSQGYTSLELESQEPEAEPEPPRSSFSKWLERKQNEREQRRVDAERKEERRMDEILRKLHLHGMDNLSEQDRHLLKRVSRRFRSRQDS